MDCNHGHNCWPCGEREESHESHSLSFGTRQSMMFCADFAHAVLWLTLFWKNQRMKLNERAALLCDHIERNADQLRVLISRLPCGARLIDCGNNARGGLEAGKALAEACLAGLGQVQFVASSGELFGWPGVLVTTDHPLSACMASQYAGWKIA